MADHESVLNVFRDTLLDHNVEVQIDAVHKLPALAAFLGPQSTRDDLIPILLDYTDELHEEVLYNLAEQLYSFVEYAGGNEYAELVINVLAQLSIVDETLVRDRAVETMREICNDLDRDQCEKSFYPLIRKLIENDWFPSKCSAASLFAICYPKMPKDKQTELRNIFRNLIQDELPMVRRSAENGLIDFLQTLDPDQIKDEFVPIFDNLAIDEQDSVRVLSVDVGIAIAKKLKDFEIYEYLLKTFKTLVADQSWHVRQKIAMRIQDIVQFCGYDKNREAVLSIYRECVHDFETEVRISAAQSLYKFSENLLETYKSHQDDLSEFEKTFVDEIMPHIRYLLSDESDLVRLAISESILSFSKILGAECFHTVVFPLVLEAFEGEESMPFKENLLKNLNSIPSDIDITKSLTSVNGMIKNILENSKMHWRTRRNVLVALAYISKSCTKDFFDQNLKIFYLHLLNDPVFAVRRTTPLILPLLAKTFGMIWAMNSLIPVIVTCAKDNRYLFRYVTLYAINELIEPTLCGPNDTTEENPDNDNKYLRDLKQIISSEQDPIVFIEVLLKISILNSKLIKMLDDEIFDSVLSQNTTYDYCKENIKLYAEDTLDNLEKNNEYNVFSISKEDDVNDGYLIGILYVLIKEFVPILKLMVKDPMENVINQTKSTLINTRNFCVELKREVDQRWAQESIKQLTNEVVKTVEDELEKELKKGEIDEEFHAELLLTSGNCEEEVIPTTEEKEEVVDVEESDKNPDNRSDSA